MSVYDNELIINGEAVRSPEQQVYKNMKDIQALKEKIKNMYSCDTELNTASISVALTRTNAPEGTTEGWLIDTTGNLFKITGGDETNILIQFYSNLQGPQGEPGSALNIDDSTTSLTKVWSSQKTSNSLDKGIYYTTVEPELSGAIYLLEKIFLSNVSSTTNVKNKDILIYIHNGVPTKIYKITEASGAEMMLELIGTYSQGVNVVANPTLEGTEAELTGLQVGDTKYKAGGGKKLYQYEISYRNTDSQILTNITFILSDELTDLASFRTWLTTNNHTATSNLFYINGGHYKGNCAYAVYLDNTTIKIGYCTPNTYSINYANLDNSANFYKREI